MQGWVRGREGGGLAKRRWGRREGRCWGVPLPEQAQQLPAAAGGPRRAPAGGRGAVGSHHVAAGPAAAARRAVVLQAEAAEAAALRPAVARVPPTPTGVAPAPPPANPAVGRVAQAPSLSFLCEEALGRPGGSRLLWQIHIKRLLKCSGQTHPRCFKRGRPWLEGLWGPAADGFLDTGVARCVNART